jgi:hypothetical protein
MINFCTGNRKDCQVTELSALLRTKNCISVTINENTAGRKKSKIN